MESNDSSVHQSLKDEEILALAQKIVREGSICDHCLGRQFAKIASGLSNEQRGQILKAALKEKGKEIEAGKCWVCNGLFEKIDLWTTRAMEALHEYDFTSFLVGTKVSGLLLENEDLLWEIAGASYAEPLKAELNREVGKRIERATGKLAEFKTPDIVVILDLLTETVEVESKALFVYGRYLKFERGLPQTRWFCRTCRGKGCEQCNFTGKLYPESVEELIRGPLLQAFKAQDIVLHGSGREDIDARMLGSGRPFVLEIKEPQRRNVDLRNAEEIVNKENAGRIEVISLRYVEREMVARIKSAKAKKTYRITVESTTSDTIPVDAVTNALHALDDAVIEQRTPARVVHRRADMIRKRKIYTTQFVSFGERHAVIELTCDAGLYIKELISGDEGRTNPSLSSLLAIQTDVRELDVLDVDLEIPVEDTNS